MSVRQVITARDAFCIIPLDAFDCYTYNISNLGGRPCRAYPSKGLTHVLKVRIELIGTRKKASDQGFALVNSSDNLSLEFPNARTDNAISVIFELESIVTPRSVACSTFAIVCWSSRKLLFCWWDPMLRILYYTLRIWNAQLTKGWPGFAK